MGIFSFLRGSPEKQIRKLRKKVKEPHGDAAVREGAAQKLYEIGTSQALRALLERFTIDVSPSVQDEREKETVCSWLVQLGETAVPPIIDFLKNERAVYWPVRALKELLGEAGFASKIKDVLLFHWENPPASAFPKVQLIKSLEGTSTVELVDVVQLFLSDEDDDARLAAIDYLLASAATEMREPVLQCYLDSEDRPRIRMHILDRLAESDLSVRGFRPAVEESLPESYALTREGKVRRIDR